MDGNRYEVSNCPNCGATCMTGMDVDFQVHCAFCGKTFRPSDVTHMSESELQKLKATHVRGERSGWVAFKAKND